MKKHDVDADEVATSMKLLQLCSLATEEQEISYATIAKALRVDVNEVEMWVVECISQGLIEANMDQFKCTLSVSRCVHRSFGPQQWRSIQHKLASLRKNVATILETIKKNDQV